MNGIAVKSLSNSSEYQLLKTLTDGDISGFETIFAAHKATLTASNVDHDKTKKKVQLTALSALAAKHVGAEISYADISKAVSIPADQIEAFVIEGARCRMQLLWITKPVPVASHPSRPRRRSPGSAQASPHRDLCQVPHL